MNDRVACVKLLGIVITYLLARAFFSASLSPYSLHIFDVDLYDAKEKRPLARPLAALMRLLPKYGATHSVVICCDGQNLVSVKIINEANLSR